MSKAANRGSASFRRDVFVAHASEDKDAVARPLAEALVRRGLTVWFDEYELRLGDSLRRRIGYGLRDSRVGAVILSRAFFRKEWPEWELDGLTARQMAGEPNVVLPVWHGVDRAEVMAYSPPLAGLLAARSDDGIEAIADAIVQALSPEPVHDGVRRSHGPVRSATARSPAGLELSVGALNVTDGEQSYEDSVQALVDDVIQIQALYWNSSDDRDLHDLTVRMVLPESSGRVLPVSAVVSADREPITAGVTVRLSLDRAQLRFVPNSINWRHAEAPGQASPYRDERLEDATLVGALPVLGDVAPQEAGSVTWQLRVIAAVLSIQVEHQMHGRWRGETDASAGETYPCRAVLRNEGNILLRGVLVECLGPARVSLTESSASPPSAPSRGGDGLVFNIADLEPGETAVVQFAVTLDSDASDGQVLHTVATARAAGIAPVYNTAALRIVER